MSRIAWVDLTNGVSGDMLLGALVSAGAPLSAMEAALEPLGLPITLRVEDVDRAGMAATKVHVGVPDHHAHDHMHDGDHHHTHHTRTWRDIRVMLQAVEEPVRQSATRVFETLALAEGHVHGIDPDDVHFHEVGALDAIADVVSACAGLCALDIDRLVVSPIALGGGTAHTAHGLIPVPVPAVLALAAQTNAPVFGGPGDFELATPTGVAIATTLADEFGQMPAMSPRRIGIGAGNRNPEGRPNVARIVIGEDKAHHGQPTAVVLEANIDDMDPRMWPSVIATLLDAGAGDAWLVPIVMKKGRPAHTLCAIASNDRAEAVRTAIFTHTSTIGIRESSIAKYALQREFRYVTIDGQRIAVKLGILGDGRVVNAMPEWEDVAAAAKVTGLPVKELLSKALGIAAQFTGFRL